MPRRRAWAEGSGPRRQLRHPVRPAPERRAGAGTGLPGGGGAEGPPSGGCPVPVDRRPMMGAMPPLPVEADIAGHTDAYFNRTKQIVERFGDCRVTYAVFLRRPVVS